MKKYTINEVAVLHNISKKTLLYYERKGLFKPSVVSAHTSYRYYTAEQFSLLKTIVFLRDLGIPIDDIREYIENRGSQGSILFLQKQLKKLRETKTRLEQAEAALTEQLEVYETAARLDERHLNHVDIRWERERKIVFLPCRNSPLGEEILLTFRRVWAFLREKNLPFSRKYGDIYLAEGLRDNPLEHVGVFSQVPLDTRGMDQVKVFPEGSYAVMHKLGGYPDAQAVADFLARIRRRGFRPEGDLLAYVLLDHGDARDVEKMLYEFQIRVI